MFMRNSSVCQNVDEFALNVVKQGSHECWLRQKKSTRSQISAQQCNTYEMLSPIVSSNLGGELPIPASILEGVSTWYMQSLCFEFC